MTSITSLSQTTGLAREASDSKKPPLLDLVNREKFTDCLQPKVPDGSSQSTTERKDTHEDRSSDRDVKSVDRTPKKKVTRESNDTQVVDDGDKSVKTDRPVTQKNADAQDSTSETTTEDVTEVPSDEATATSEDNDSTEQDALKSIELLVQQLISTPVCDCPVPVDVTKIVATQDDFDPTGVNSGTRIQADLTKLVASIAPALDVAPAATLPVEGTEPNDIATDLELQVATAVTSELVTENPQVTTDAATNALQITALVDEISDELSTEFVDPELDVTPQGKIDLSSLPATALVADSEQLETPQPEEDLSAGDAPQATSQAKADLTVVTTTVVPTNKSDEVTSSESSDESSSESSAPSIDLAEPTTQPHLHDQAVARESGLGIQNHQQSQATSHAYTHTPTNLNHADHQRFMTRATRALELANARGGDIRIRLHPPELGSLRVEMKLEAGQMVAKVETETTAAKNLLVENLPQLKERLQELGVTVESFDVNVAQRDSRQDQQDSQEQAKRNRAIWNNQLPETPSEPEPTTPRLPWQRSEGLNIVI